MSDIRSLEHPTLKVPYESLNKRFRAAQKVLEKEASAVVAASDKPKPDASLGQANKEEVVKQLDRMLSALDKYGDRVGEAVKSERAMAENCRQRLVHLMAGCDDMGGTMMEENVVSQAGAAHCNAPELDVRKTIEAAGLEPLKRDSWYRPVSAAGPALGEVS